MNYVGGLFESVGLGINAASTFAGKVVDSAIDGQYGVGTFHAKLIELGTQYYGAHARLSYVATQGLTAGGSLLSGWFTYQCFKKSISENDALSSLEKKIWRTLAFESGVLIFAGTTYVASAVNLTLSPLRQIIAKDVLIKTALTMGDATAMAAVLNYANAGDPSKYAWSEKWGKYGPPVLQPLMGAAYLSGRLYDVVFHFGVIGQSLLQGNTRPLFSRINTAIGHVVVFAHPAFDALIDGAYGLAALNRQVIALGHRAYDIPARAYHLASHAATIGVGGGVGMVGGYVLWKVVKEKLSRKKKDKFKPYLKPGMILSGAALGIGTMFWANATNCGLRPLTAEITKQLLPKTLLAAGDGFALYTATMDDDAKRGTRVASGAYLALRLADLVANYGAVSQGLLRCNPVPLMANVDWFMSWVR